MAPRPINTPWDVEWEDGLGRLRLSHIYAPSPWNAEQLVRRRPNFKCIVHVSAPKSVVIEPAGLW